MTLSEKEKEILLTLAKESITGKAIRQKIPISEIEGRNLFKHCGAFVSLYVKEELRGCIGIFSEEEPLYMNVQKMALTAATSDTRFQPIEPDEMVDIAIEISVLSPRRKIDDISEISLGKHGIYIRRGIRRGTLLPQVATSQQWTVEEFLGHCARYKAGIGWEGWKTAEIYIFEAIIFRSSHKSGASA